MPALLEEKKRTVGKICDESDNEFVPKEGMLVLVKQRNRRELLGRVVRVTSNAYGEPYIEIVLIDSRTSSYYYTDELTLISTNSNSITPKDPPLIDRIENFRKNLTLALNNTSRNSFLDYNLMSKLATFVTPTSSAAPPNYKWFWRNIAESLDDPRKISYAPTMDVVDNNRRRIKTGIAGFLKNKAKLYGAHFTNEEANRIGYLVGVHFPGNYNYKFEIVTGTDIFDAYNNSLYHWNSCMRGRRFVKWYSINPDKVALVKINLDGKYVGRALLWNTEQGRKVLDRVYPSDNGPQTIAIHNFAIQNGWDYKTSQSSEDNNLDSQRADYTVTMTTLDGKVWDSLMGYPYLDTFKYTNDNPAEATNITLNTSKGHYTFLSTEGRWETKGEEDEDEDDYHCEECGAGMYEDDYYNGLNDEVLCEQCFGERYVSLDYYYKEECIDRTVEIGQTFSCYTCGVDRLTEHGREVVVSGRSVRLCNECAEDREKEHKSSEADILIPEIVTPNMPLLTSFYATLDTSGVTPTSTLLYSVETE